jgi:hypothetical protein
VRDIRVTMKFFLLVICFVVASVTAEITASTSQVSVTFNGQSGKFKIFPSNNSNAFIQVSFEGLVEVDAAGTETNIRVNNFASQTFAWVGPTTVSVPGGTAQKVSFVSTVSVGHGLSTSPVNFNCDTWIYEQAGNATNGNQTIFVPANSLKFAFNISGAWPWAAASDKLKVQLKYLVPGSAAGNLQPVNGSDEKVVDFAGVGAVRVSDQAVVDGENVAIQSLLEQQGSNTLMSFVFPQYNNSIIYDPVMTTSSTSSAACSTSTAMFTLLSITLVCLVSQLFF